MNASADFQPPSILASPRKRRGFTLLEILVAVVLLATAFTIIWSTFSVTIDGWRRSGEFIDRINHGDFVIDQLVSSLRSMAFFPNRPDKFGFWLEAKGGGNAPRDVISWVTSGTAFMLPEDPLSRGLHRIMITVEDSRGESGLAIRAFQHLKDEIEKDDVDPWFVSSRVIGLECRIYNFEDEVWEDKWEDTNSIPRLVEISVFMEPIERSDPVIKLQRVVEIPVAPAVTGAVRVTQSPGETGTRRAGSRPSGQEGVRVSPGQQGTADQQRQGTAGQPRRGGN